MATRENRQSEDEASNRGKGFDPNAAPDASAKEVPPQAVSHGSPVSEDEFRRMKQKAQKSRGARVERAIEPQTDDSARSDESASEPEHD